MSPSPASAVGQARQARRQGNLALAERLYRQALTASPGQAAPRTELAQLLLSAGHYEPAMVQVQELLNRNPADGEAWRLAGLAFLGNQQLEQAEQALSQARSLSPENPAVRLARAQLAQESGDSQHCLRLTRGLENETAVLLRARAFRDSDMPGEAQATLRAYLTHDPTASSVHALLARLSYLDQEPDWSADLAQAIAAHPDHVPLRLTYAGALKGAGELAQARTELLVGIERQPAYELYLMLADCHLEGGDNPAALQAAERARALAPQHCEFSRQRIDALLAVGSFDEARGLLESLLHAAPGDQRHLARYATLLRAVNDPRAKLLFDPERLVHVVDRVGAADLAPLTTALAAEHQRSGPPLDQSLRGGSQTARSLLQLRGDVIQTLIGDLKDAVRAWAQHLPREPGHPFDQRLKTGDPHLRGCWSVCLNSGGHHVDHIHSQGVVSAVYYVSVPQGCRDRGHAGWLRFGRPRFPMPGVEAALHVEPRPGRLVLFPSYFWHGTEPFADESPRLTVAFDATF
ncbi:MAG: tetratricopeptide repeat protein [Pseudomonadota bacterium]